MVVDIRTWVKNVVNQPPSVTPNDIIVPLSTPTMSAKAVLICRPNSHPFQERTLSLDQPVKVGRSVARARATPTNAIFDCKVLSRHHALLWYENGKFYLQDTKSSNGTFVNNNRLSAGGVESVPHEVCSGDIVQFGVDVVENNRKVTHGCIVATLKLYLHDGKEAKASPSLSVGTAVGSVPLDELYKLNQYLQDALQREQLLEAKLTTLHNLVEQAREATTLSWQAFIGEDRLLSRVEILESQLLSYSKNYSEDKMREEVMRLQEDKTAYQSSAKESLRKVHVERLQAQADAQALTHALATARQEAAAALAQQHHAHHDLQELAQKYSTSQQKEAELISEIAAAEERERAAEQRLQELLERVDSQKETMLQLHAQLDKLQQDNILLHALIAELDKCTVNNCPVELKFRVEKILKEGLMDDIKNTNVTKEDATGDEDEEIDNNKENNVPFSHQTEVSNKLKECRETLDYKEMEELLCKLQDELQQLEDSSEENDNKTQDLDKLRQQISHWTSRLAEQSVLSQKESQVTLVNEPLDNCQYVKRDPETMELKQKLHIAQIELLEKSTTIAKMSEEVENLLETSALINAKINILENDLLEEKQSSQKYKKELESVQRELLMSQQMITTTSNEELQMKKKIDSLLIELNKRPSIQSYEELTQKCSNLEKQMSQVKLQNGDDSIDANIAENDIDVKLEQNGSIVKFDEFEKQKLIELQEELVFMKERYAECNVEKLDLNKSLEALQKDYNALVNKSYNTMFYYIAPLVFLVAYLLLSSLFS